MQTTVNLSENAYQHISQIARLTERSFDEVIEEAVESKFSSEVEMLKKSIEVCSDEEVLKLANFLMPEKQSGRLSSLLKKNGESSLTDKERGTLDSLMQINRINDLRKAIGIVEAMKRGLIKSAEDLA